MKQQELVVRGEEVKAGLGEEVKVGLGEEVKVGWGEEVKVGWGGGVKGALEEVGMVVKEEGGVEKVAEGMEGRVEGVLRGVEMEEDEVAMGVGEKVNLVGVAEVVLGVEGKENWVEGDGVVMVVAG